MNEKPQQVYERLIALKKRPQKTSGNFVVEEPKFVHGRLVEAVHLGGYSFERACRELEWLLEDNRWKQCGPSGYENIDEFLATLQFDDFTFAIEERRKIAKKLSDLRATQRAIGKTLGVGKSTINRDISVPIGTSRKKTQKLNSYAEKNCKIEKNTDGANVVICPHCGKSFLQQ